MGSRVRGLTRRGLVGGGIAAGAAALLPAARAGAAPSAHPWDDLAGSISGEVILAGEPSYLARVTPAALHYLRESPLAVVVPRTDADVATAVSFARSQSLPLRVRGGGHGYAGYCTTSGVLLDMSGMREVAFDADSRTVRLGGGVRGIDAHSGLRRHGHWIPAGNCTGVGLAGYVQGGGFGFYQRRYGLGCDNVIEADLVTADGRTIRTNAQAEPDLLWALRGAGGGNLGVVTSFRMKAFPTDGHSSVAMIIWRGCPTAPLVSRIAEMIDSTGDEITWHFTCDATSPDALRGSSLPQVTLMCHGFTPPGRIESALAEVTGLYQPALSIVRELGFWQSHEFLSGNHLPENGLWYVKSCFLPGPLRPESIEILTRAAATWPGSSIGRSGTGFIPWIGRPTEVAADATAFVHRTPGYLAVIQTCWGNEDPTSVIDAGRAWAEQTYAELLPLSTGGSYQNWIDPDLSDPLLAYYGANLPRLITVKSAVDPEGFFRLPQGLPASRT